MCSFCMSIFIILAFRSLNSHRVFKRSFRGLTGPLYVDLLKDDIFAAPIVWAETWQFESGADSCSQSVLAGNCTREWECRVWSMPSVTIQIGRNTDHGPAPAWRGATLETPGAGDGNYSLPSLAGKAAAAAFAQTWSILQSFGNNQVHAVIYSHREKNLNCREIDRNCIFRKYRDCFHNGCGWKRRLPLPDRGTYRRAEERGCPA